eukprot:7023260-Alexandrium_andersonii.AAC.1
MMREPRSRRARTIASQRARVESSGCWTRRFWSSRRSRSFTKRDLSSGTRRSGTAAGAVAAGCGPRPFPGAGATAPCGG